ncbi:MAG: lipocalin family protein [Lachnoclostridium sp.]|nr:lipocalin family protein [Lachnoclostridium sp.]
MKKLNLFIPMVLMAVMSAFTFVSCSDDDDKIDNGKIVGTWESVLEEWWEKEDGKIVDEGTDDDTDLRVEFKADGTVTQYEYYNSSWHLDITGNYSISGNKLTIVYDEDGDEYTSTQNIEMPDDNTLVVSGYWKEDNYEGYEKTTFRRIK